MSGISKFIIFAAGCVALYGIATGQDLNELFTNVIAQAKPFCMEVINGAYSLFKEVIE